MEEGNLESPGWPGWLGVADYAVLVAGEHLYRDVHLGVDLAAFRLAPKGRLQI